MSKGNVEITTWEDAEDKRLESYACYDAYGNEITVNTKNPESHTGGILDNENTLFYNLDIVISKPDHTSPYTGGGSPKTQANAQKGQMVTFIKDNFVHELDIPHWSENLPPHSVEVTVLYTNNATKNYTTTYGIRMNPSE